MDSNAKFNDKPLRVMLWTVPRSLSTAFEKCLGYFPNTQIMNEPFCCAYHMGPDSPFKPQAGAMKDFDTKDEHQLSSKPKVQMDLPMAFDYEECTYDFVKRQLEAVYPGKDLVFCKDMAYTLDAKYDKIPSGYRHTYLIRHPYRIFPSYKKMISNFYQFMLGNKDFRLPDLPPAIIPSGYAVKELYELVAYFQKIGEPDPIIIDADDLLENPSSILRQYCAILGIPFNEDLLEWPAGKETMKSWIGTREILLRNLDEKSGGFYDTALNSTRFGRPKEMPRREDLSEDVLACADASMSYYKKMYEMRIRP